ncbi:hypothetical protein VKT23_006240 [Stygiomarasmius scandens]|uniref:Cytochrome P450 n=1 Tax=Marasmiellus scandens TaxID=2682957 RepID=A0ABR1JN21_9AGAR
MGYDWSMVFLPYDDVWKKQRQTFQPYFLQRNIDQYNPILLQETRAMLRRMLDEPQGWVGHCRFLFASTIYQIVYGLRLTGPEDPVSLNGERVLKTISDAAVPGAFWVDFIPWSSIAPFQRTAALWRTYGEEFLNAPWESVQRGMATGKATTCVTSDLISQLEGAREKNGRDNAPEDVRLMKAIAAIAYAGGSDTTVNTLLFFIAAMCLYPDVQRKAQQELDRVVGTGRLPDFKDREELVYIEAVIKESIRWQPVLPFAVPHASSSSDIYNGYYIPKGSIVVGNAWGLLHDPTVYPEPEKFIPERYLTEDGKKLREDIPDPVAAFGFGRRICPGRFLSSSSMFIAVASLLHSFTLSPPEGQKMELKIEPSLITRPADFECMVRPRGEWAVGLVRETENDS